MGASAAGRGRAQRSGRSGLNRNNNRSPQSNDSRRNGRPQKNPFENTLKLQQVIARAQDNGDAVVRRGDRKQRRHQIYVSGWRECKAASNPDGCIKQLREFIERKATTQREKVSSSQRKIRITSARVIGDDYIISALPEDVEFILKLNNFKFVDVELSIEEKEKSSQNQENTSKAPEAGEGLTSQQITDRMKTMLERRYNVEQKLLDLSTLGTDPEFMGTGILETRARKTKFFQALMSVISKQFKTTAQRREAFLSVSLANNGLPDVSSVTSLAQTLPDILNLDLSNNDFKSTIALRPWSRRFPSLDILLLSGNPMEIQQPDYQQDIIKWYRTLRMLNSTQVRTEEEAAVYRQNKRVPPVIASNNFQDASSIGENFVKHFIPLFDTDRSTLARSFYDSASTFSLNVNTKAPHSDEYKPQAWGDTIKKSRNLVKITTLPARISRQHVGTQAIEQSWLSLPATKHPDIASEAERYCTECQPAVHLPDPTGQNPNGVQGLMIIVHGQFNEMNTVTGEITAVRSFDRTFIIGPGGGLGGIKVVADILTLRSFGGYDAWIPSQYTSPPNKALPPPQIDASVPMTQVPHPVQLINQPSQPQAPFPTEAGFGLAVNGKTEEHAQKEQLVIQLARATNMTLQYTTMCLEQAGWNLQTAGSMFEQVRPTLPADAFLQNGQPAQNILPIQTTGIEDEL